MNNDDNDYQKDLHELFTALHSTLKTANSEMKSNDEGLNYTIDEVEFELPVEIGFADAQKTSFSPSGRTLKKTKFRPAPFAKKNSKKKQTGMRVALNKSQLAPSKYSSLDELVKEKKILSDMGRVRIKFSRDMVQD